MRRAGLSLLLAAIAGSPACAGTTGFDAPVTGSSVVVTTHVGTALKLQEFYATTLAQTTPLQTYDVPVCVTQSAAYMVGVGALGAAHQIPSAHARHPCHRHANNRTHTHTPHLTQNYGSVALDGSSAVFSCGTAAAAIRYVYRLWWNGALVS